MLSHLRATCRFYTGHPKELGPSRVIHFTSERQFIQILHEGRPVVVAFTIKCPYTKHFDGVLEEAAAEFYPNIKFVRVECPKYPGFCVARQRKEYPFIEIFHNPEEVGFTYASAVKLQLLQSNSVFLRYCNYHIVRLWLGFYVWSSPCLPHHLLPRTNKAEEATNQAKVADPNITKYSVKVLPFNYDLSAYGFREFFKKHDMYSSNSS